MEFNCAGLFNQPVVIKMVNEQWGQELEVCCRFQPVSRDGWLGFQCGALLFGGAWKEGKVLFQPDGSMTFLFPDWKYEVSPTTMEVYEDSRDPFSDSEYYTPEIMLEEVEEALTKLNLPIWLESTWNEYFSVGPMREHHVRTA